MNQRTDADQYCPLTMGSSVLRCWKTECAWFMGNRDAGRCAVVGLAEALNGPLEVFTDNLDLIKLARHAKRREAK